MPLPRWLLRFFPRLAPQGQWRDAICVTRPASLDLLDRIYAEQVAWCESRGIAIQTPTRRVTYRVWPDHLRPPKEFGGIGKVLAPNVISGDTGGTLLVGRLYQDNADVLTHELRHAITGESGHPEWLFPSS